MNALKQAHVSIHLLSTHNIRSMRMLAKRSCLFACFFFSSRCAEVWQFPLLDSLKGSVLFRQGRSTRGRKITTASRTHWTVSGRYIKWSYQPSRGGTWETRGLDITLLHPESRLKLSLPRRQQRGLAQRSTIETTQENFYPIELNINFAICKSPI